MEYKEGTKHARALLCMELVQVPDSWLSHGSVAEAGMTVTAVRRKASNLGQPRQFTSEH